MTAKSKDSGFTLTELMIAMAFIAFVLIFITTAIVQLSRIYNKGLSIRQINQAGRQLTEDMTRSFRYANASTVIDPGTYKADEKRLCVNGTTYVWNIENGAGLDDEPKNTYAGSTAPIRFIKVNDGLGELCSNPSMPIDPDDARDIVGSRLAVKSVDVTIPASEQGRIVDIAVVISTAGLNRPVTTPTGFSCEPGSEGAFCAFGKFETTIYVRN